MKKIEYSRQNLYLNGYEFNIFADDFMNKINYLGNDGWNILGLTPFFIETTFTQMKAMNNSFINLNVLCSREV